MLKILFVISENPRFSPRPAEVIRIAAGLNSSGQCHVSIWLSQVASILLENPLGDLADVETLERYLPVFSESQGVFYTAPGSGLAAPVAPGLEQTWKTADLAELVPQFNTVVQF